MNTKKKPSGHMRFEYNKEMLETYFYSSRGGKGISRNQMKDKINAFISKKTKYPKYIIFSPIID